MLGESQESVAHPPLTPEGEDGIRADLMSIDSGSVRAF
jgi:hypothetical protein